MDGWIGWGWVWVCWGVSHAFTHAYICTHKHACTHMHVKHDKHGCLHVSSHLQFLYMYTCAYVCVCVCVYVCVCMYMCMCVGTPPMSPDASRYLPPTCSLPRATGSPKHQNSISPELIKIIRFCLKILYL